MVYDVAYNMQTAVDAKNHIIVAVDAINNPADQGQLYGMEVESKQILDVEEITVVGDKGYYTEHFLKSVSKTT